MSPPTSASPELVAAARAWMAQDPDPATRAAVEAMLAEGDSDRLRGVFGTRLGFGTAGIRGRLGPGPGGLNRLLVRQVAAGVGNVMRRSFGDADSRGVVIGFDGRHGSLAFAEDAARVLGGQGLTVFLYDDVVPTPLLAHAILHLGCRAGIMVTASHNPPQDNGIKVYWDHGAQIVPPVDQEISEEIGRVAESDTAPGAPDLGELRGRGLVRTVPAGQRQAYVQAVLGLRVHQDTGIRAVYTAMHGVGRSLLTEVLQAAGHVAPVAVPQQADPDPDFPTVAFPNPEEPGALDLAVALAEAEGAELIIAHDPDADRLAVAIPSGAASGDGDGWRRLSGNEVGLLLADDLLRHRVPAPPRDGHEEGQPLVCTTIVSSSLLADVAAAHGAASAEVLTGFKWLAAEAMAWDGPFVLGYEEALGYSAGGLVMDKDGVSAALLWLDLASWLKARDRTLQDALDAFDRRYGVAASSQRSLKLPGAEGKARIAFLMAALRDDPPREIAGRRVWRLRDVLAGTARDLRDGTVTDLDLPQSNVLAFDLEGSGLEGSGRVLARPSGTEPKLKLYFEARTSVGPDEDLDQARSRARAMLAELEAEVWERVNAG